MTYVRHGEERAVEVGRLQSEAVAVEGSAPQWPHDGHRKAEERAGACGLLLVEAQHLAERGVALTGRVSEISNRKAHLRQPSYSTARHGTHLLGLGRVDEDVHAALPISEQQGGGRHQPRHRAAHPHPPLKLRLALVGRRLAKHGWVA